MRLDDLYLWYLVDPATPRYVGALKLFAAGKGVSLHYGQDWLVHVAAEVNPPLFAGEVAVLQAGMDFG